MVGKWQLKDHEVEQRLFNRRLATAAVLIILLFFALILKLVNLQISQLQIVFKIIQTETRKDV